VLPLFERREFAAGETIIQWSEPGDRLYVIESGLVSVVVPERTGAETVLAQLGPGQIFGEMAMLTGQPRSANVRALLPTVAHTISYSAFYTVAGHSPILLLNIGRMLASRLARMIRTSSHEERRALVVLIGPAPPPLGSLVATNLLAALAAVTRRRAVLLDIPAPRAAALPGREWSPGLEAIRGGEQTLLHLSRLRLGPTTLHVVNLPEANWATDRAAAEQAGRAIARLGRAAEFVLVNLTGPPNLLLEAVVPLASRVLLLAGSSALNTPDLARTARHARRLLTPDATLDCVMLANSAAAPSAVVDRARAVLGVSSCTVLPAPAELGREAASIAPPMTLRAPDQPTSRTITRLAREVAGLRVGLALGSGAAKGVAHVGVVKALAKLGVPIDVVTGTSIGALVGAGVGMGMGMDHIEETMNRMVDLWGDALRPVVPRFSLIGSGGLDRIVKQLAGDLNCEELPTTYGAVATDLTSGRSVYIFRGPLAQAVRTSISIPLIFPPVQVGEYVLVDGFLTNPIPTQLARLLGADIVLASTLSGSAAQTDPPPIEYEHLPDGGAGGRRPALNILETYHRCAEIFTAGRSVRDCLTADLTVRPQLPSLSWKDFQKGGVPLEAGERSVYEQVDGLRELLPWLRG
jgi:NTE family protein